MATPLPPVHDAAGMAGDARFEGLAARLRSMASGSAETSATRADIREAAEGFEAMFLNLLLKEMMPEKEKNEGGEEDEELFGNGLFGNGLGSDTYQQLFISSLSEKLAANGALGLADLIEKEVAAQAGLTDESSNGTEPQRLQPLSLRRSTFAAAVYGEQQARGSEQVTEQYRGSYLRLLEPVKGRRSSGYGTRHDPFTAELTSHRGIDIAAATGTKIQAAAAGRVSFSGTKPGYGNIVIIEHEGGLQTRYAHNADNYVREGDTVTAGQVVATVGETGRATGPHLHFEVRRDGVPVDPSALLTSAD